METAAQMVTEEYSRALKLGTKEANEFASQGKPTNPAVLDEILPENSAQVVQDLGLLEIPAERIIGTKSAGRISLH